MGHDVSLSRASPWVGKRGQLATKTRCEQIPGLARECAARDKDTLRANPWVGKRGHLATKTRHEQIPGLARGGSSRQRHVASKSLGWHKRAARDEDTSRA